MANENTRIKAGISAQLFRFATSVIRIHSNRVMRFANLPEVIEDFAKNNKCLYDGMDREDAELHLRIIPSNGDILLDIVVCQSSMESLEKSITVLEGILESSVTLIDALSLMMFEYVAQDKADRIVKNLIRDDENARNVSSSVTSSRKKHSH